MREREKGRTQEQAAASANLRSRKTVTTYEQPGSLPGELKQPRQYPTRPDAFQADGPRWNRCWKRRMGFRTEPLKDLCIELASGSFQQGDGVAG